MEHGRELCEIAYRESVADEPARPRASAADPDRLAALTARVDELAAGLAELRQTVAALEAQVRSLHEASGRTSP